MVNKTCSWGVCRSDSRRKHHEDMKGVTFKRFPQPRTQKERCMEWIRRCNRPHDQLHIGNVGYYHFVCSKHFVDGAEDPVSASNATKTPKSRNGRSSKHPSETPAKQVCSEISTCHEENQTGVLRGDDGAMSDVEVEEASTCGNLPILPQLLSPVKASKTEPLSSKTATIADILSKESPRKSCKRSEQHSNLTTDMADEESSRTDSRHSSSPATPNISNPGTPRSEMSQDVRATPPLARATPPLARATPPLARATPPLPQGQPQLPHGPPVIPVRSITQAPPAPSPLAQMHHHQSKYASLLAVIEDMGRDIRPTYAGNRSSTERLKRSIVHARILVRECLMECERSART